MAVSDTPIVVTGLGAIGAGGRNAAELWESSRLVRVSVQTRDIAGRPFPVYAAPDPELSAPDRHRVRRAGRSSALALAAAREAWQDARLDQAGIDPTRIGIVVGSSRGPADVVDASQLRTAKRPSEALYTAFSSTPGLLAAAFGTEGGALSLSATCTSGAAAIYTARQMLRSGDLDIVLAGGTEAPLIPSILERMAASGVLAPPGKGPDALRPFDLHRHGTVLGEGAAFLVLETAASAARRNGRALGTLLGAALSSESEFRSRPSESGQGLQRAARAALAQSPAVSAIDLAHLHGTGTRINDSTESACLQALFGPGSAPLCWGSKGITGHTLGAASAFQAVLSLLALRDSFVPATANCTVPDPACAIRLNLGKGSSQPLRTALCLTSGFWGKNSALLFGAAN